MKMVSITCQFPDKYNAQPLSEGQISILVPEGGSRVAKITGRMNQIGDPSDRKWQVELEYEE